MYVYVIDTRDAYDDVLHTPYFIPDSLQIAYDMASDPALAAVVDIITTHVAGSLEENTPTPAVAISLGKPLWQACSPPLFLPHCY
jgi:hypothetical protein